MDNKSHYSNVKDLDTARPRYCPTPKAPKGISRRSYDLYLQDEASAIAIDKYGYEKGLKFWEDSIGMGKKGSAMFAMSQTIADEKTLMMDDIQFYPKDYFERSYLSVWKEWIEKGFGKKK